MPDWNSLQNTKEQLVRKSLQGGAFLAETTVAAPARFTDPLTSLLVAQTGFEALGLLTADGMAHARESASSEVTSFGRRTPTRTDITSDTTTITIAAQETKLQTIGLATGAVGLKTLVPLKGGEVIIKKPQNPSPRTYRLMTVAVDLDEGGEIYIGRFFPRAKVSSFSDQAFSNGDEALLWGVTMTGQFDSALGYSESWFFGGPGWSARLADMGFLAAATT